MGLTSDGLSESTGSATPFLVSGRNADLPGARALLRPPRWPGGSLPHPKTARGPTPVIPTVPFRRNRR